MWCVSLSHHHRQTDGGAALKFTCKVVFCWTGWNHDSSDDSSAGLLNFTFHVTSRLLLLLLLWWWEGRNSMIDFYKDTNLYMIHSITAQVTRDGLPEMTVECLMMIVRGWVIENRNENYASRGVTLWENFQRGWAEHCTFNCVIMEKGKHTE